MPCECLGGRHFSEILIERFLAVFRSLALSAAFNLSSSSGAEPPAGVLAPFPLVLFMKHQALADSGERIHQRTLEEYKDLLCLVRESNGGGRMQPGTSVHDYLLHDAGRDSHFVFAGAFHITSLSPGSTAVSSTAFLSNGLRLRASAKQRKTCTCTDAGV